MKDGVPLCLAEKVDDWLKRKKAGAGAVKEEKPIDRRQRVQPKEQPPEERIKNFREVTGTYTNEEAQNEAKRCLKCKTPMCIEGCPVGIDIPKFVIEIAEGKTQEAAGTIKDRTACRQSADASARRSPSARSSASSV